MKTSSNTRHGAPDQPDAKSAGFFEAVLESAPDAMIVVNDQGLISVVNGQAEQMFGYTRDQLLNQPIELLIPQRLRKGHTRERNEYLNAPRLRQMGIGRELFGRRSDGSEFPTEISLSPLKTEAGLFVSSAIRDVTVRKQLEDDIIAARHEAERANKANSAFLAAASHDLRQPVQALSLLTGALRRTVTDARALEMIEIQNRSLTAMTNLLNSLLDISRLDAGAVSPEFEEFSVSMLIDRLSGEFARQASHKGLNFEALPSTAVVRSDVNLLGEILQNLVSNGIRYTDEGSVRLHCEVADDKCRVSVTDTGIGIQADQLDEIFEEFHQCNPTSSSKEGFGLGLAIVQRLASVLDHKIEVRSVPGEGSCFSIAVPLVAGDSLTAAADPEPAAVPDTNKASGFIVLVEDDREVAAGLTMLFESAGYTVVAAVSRSEAMKKIEKSTSPPDLIVSDYHLADADTGVTTIRSLRESARKNLPAFILSGDTSELIEEARALSNCLLVRKPVDPDDLLVAAQTSVATGEVPS